MILKFFNFSFNNMHLGIIILRYTIHLKKNEKFDLSKV